MKRIFGIFIVLYSINAFGYYTETIPNQCGAMSKMVAVFTQNQYTCNNGEYLPADTLGCVSCPADYTCTGGTFAFNENEYQGAVKSQTYITYNLTNMCSTNVPHEFIAVYEPNQYTCASGYYLPAGNDWLTDSQGCTECPQNNYCPGGTYTFNEITTQGIEPCPSNIPHAPTGSAVCYPHILHIGENNIYLKSTKLTTPSLNIAIEGSIFYANLTTTPTYMNKASEQSLKIMVNGVEYYVCDDTTLR